MEVWLHSISTLFGGSVVRFTHRPLYLGKRVPVTNCKGGLVIPSAGQSALEKTISFVCLKSNPESSSSISWPSYPSILRAWFFPDSSVPNIFRFNKSSACYFGMYAEEYVKCPLLLQDFDQNHSSPICNTFNKDIEIHEKCLQPFSSCYSRINGRICRKLTGACRNATDITHQVADHKYSYCSASATCLGLLSYL